MKLTKGSWALVTGASSGIGLAISRELANRGLNLVLLARRKAVLEKTAQELSKSFQIKTHCIPFDLLDYEKAPAVFQEIEKERIDIQVLVNNAGIGHYGKFEEVPLEKHRQTILVNCLALTEFSFLALGHMKNHRHDSGILNISSLAAFQGVPNFSVYCGTKSYVKNFSEAINYELKDENIQVTTVYPGGTTTSFFTSSGQKITSAGQKSMMSAEEVAILSLNALEQKRMNFIPGKLNKIAGLLSKLIPSYLAVKLTFFAMSKAVKKA